MTLTILPDTCPVSNRQFYNATCSPDSKSSLSNYLYVFILGQLILGAGGTPLYTLGTAFIDDSVPKHKSSVYIGIGYSMSLLGPAIGYVVGGQLLKIYVDFNQQVRTDITPNDPRWVGAWWVAFVACSFCTWLLVAPFSYFPRHLPGSQKIQAEKISEAHSAGQGQKNIGGSVTDFSGTLLSLLRNPVLMCLVIAAALEALVATGFATFLPKFIENQFGFSSSYSATLAGVVLIPGAALGQILSGILVSKLKLRCKSIIKFIAITCSIALVLNSVFLFAKCGNEPFAGVSETYNGTSTFSNLTAPCNENCHCLRSVYLPVCGTDQIQYFSPCYAGCSSVHDGKVYSNCSCVVNPKNTIGNITNGAVAGKCPSRCTVLPAFLSIFFLTIIFTFLAVTPTTVAILRCVPDMHRSFAMGVHMLFLRIVGTIPGPIIFGVAIDHSCTLWSVDECGKHGACWVYNNHLMAYTLLGISATSKAISITFILIAFFLYKPPPVQTCSSQKNTEIETSVQL
uniref:Uncharacterized protein n=1 Tax=Sphaerodactylus townsendi TaxID=933632 RepID=A0ACB8EQK4_9SAUR